ncbi:GEVED domain-containing protein [Bizionia arctica]|uniref:T9SS type A sorting domain-containing protein n=1 Tax=Bizionia arctica TaxID=1495645 RepID=A0A917GBT7_9FLAO|nr:GEVED domain-containing protein [Bizionia arctica]GGG35267.1 hypothetical protein GCM10010976_03690 [Bizionia arctica]
MKKITLLFFTALVATFMWNSGYAQTACSQETLGGAEVEDGYGNLQLLIFANDLVIDADTAFTLNTIQFNVLVTPGVPVTGVQFYFYKNSASGNGPGLELGSTAVQAPTSITNVGTAFGFDLMQVSTDLAVPYTLVGSATESISWVGVTIEYSGASSYMEVVTALNTPNESYFLANGIWVPGSDPIDGFDQAADGVMSFFGNCDAIASCAGMPDAGIALVNPTMGGPGTSYTVSAQGYTVNAGMSFQWQSNTNGAGWVDEGAPTVEVLAYSATAPAQVGDLVEWRFSSTCTNSSETAISGVATFTTTEVEYCDVLFPSGVEPITYVNFAGIENTTSAATGGAPLEDFTAQIASVNLGEAYPIEIKGNTDGAFTTKIVAYIDWNQDGVFDNATGSNEMYLLPDIFSSTGEDGVSSIGSITVPTSAIMGNTTMRVMKRFNVVAAPCNITGYGQAEDYTVEVSDATTSIDENNLLAGTSLFPNPLNGNTFYVNAPKLNGENIEVRIVDLAGRQIFNNTLVVNNNKLTVSVNDALTSGMYLVTLKHAGEVHTYRLIKK